MYNIIMDAVTQRLDELFPECRIYTDTVEQGLETPCFFVSLLEPSERQLMGRRYLRETGMAIQYIPDESGIRSQSREINQVLETLMNGMEYIKPKGGLMSGTKRKERIEDGVLHFAANYNGFVLKGGEEEEMMDSMTAAIGVRKGETEE